MSDTYDDLIDQAYNVRRALPDHPATFARWRQESDAYLAACPAAQIDLPYGPDTGQRLDLFPATAGSNQTDPPLILLIHGGYWQALDKADNRQMARAFNQAGFSVAVLNYRLCPTVGIQAICEDVTAAAQWLAKEAPTLGVACSQMAVIGHSAGAHLAAMLACLMTQEAALVDSELVYLGLVSGVFQLSPLLATRINDKLGLSPSQAEVLSPTTHSPPSGLWVDAFVGEYETAGFFDQHRALQAAWGQHTRLHHRVVASVDHLTIWDQLTDRDSPVASRMLTALEQRTATD